MSSDTTEESASSQPTFIRYQRVENILISEPAFKPIVANKTEIVMKPNGQQHKFSLAVVQTTEKIHASGKDPYSVPRPEVVQAALQFIGVANGHAASISAPSTASVAKAQKSRTKSKAVATAAAPAATDDGPETDADPEDNLLCPKVAIYSMLIGAKTMAVKHDKYEGNAKRLKAIETLAKEYRDLS